LSFQLQEKQKSNTCTDIGDSYAVSRGEKFNRLPPGGLMQDSTTDGRSIIRPAAPAMATVALGAKYFDLPMSSTGPMMLGH